MSAGMQEVLSNSVVQGSFVVGDHRNAHISTLCQENFHRGNMIRKDRSSKRSPIIVIKAV